MFMLRPAVLACAFGLLSACGVNDLAEPPVDLGDFVLGHNIVVADKAEMVPISRSATADEWETAMKKAVADRFGRYEGNRIYNIGISVDGYALAPPGIPVVAAPKSVLVITANVWDDAKAQKLNPEGKQLTVFESFDGESVIGTGLTKTKQQQLDALSYNAAKAVERWFLENPEWFGIKPAEKPAKTPAQTRPAKDDPATPKPAPDAK